MRPPQKNTLFRAKEGVDQNPPITNKEWREQQNQDKTTAKIKNLLQSKKLGQENIHDDDSKQMKTMHRHKHQFILRNGFLYKKTQFHSCDQPSLQLYCLNIIDSMP